MVNYRNTLRLITVIALILSLIMLKGYIGAINSESMTSTLNEFESSYIIAIAFILVSALASLCCVPISWFKAFGAIYFGFSYGLIYGLISTIISATVSFALARYLGKDFVNRVYEKRVKPKLKPRQREYLEKGSTVGFLELFVLRNLYFIPFSATNYMMGMSKISFKTYIIATVVGIIPGTIVYIYLISNSLNPINLLSELKFLLLALPAYYLGIFLLNKKYKNQLA